MHVVKYVTTRRAGAISVEIEEMTEGSEVHLASCASFSFLQMFWEGPSRCTAAGRVTGHDLANPFPKHGADFKGELLVDPGGRDHFLKEELPVSSLCFITIYNVISKLLFSPFHGIFRHNL